MKLKEIREFRRDATIAEILHDAADFYLADTDATCSNVTTRYTCVAIYRSIFGDNTETVMYRAATKNLQFKQIVKGLRNMGLIIDSFTLEGKAFLEYHGVERQHARYGWLKLAALMAEEQGV